MANKEHPSDQLLSSVFDKSLPPEHFAEILSHVASCAQCERRMAQAEPAVVSYVHFRNRVAPLFPQPSTPWSNLSDELDRMERERPPSRSTA